MTDRDLEYIAAKLAEMLSVQPRWMKLKQAAAYSSISKAALIRLIEDKKIKGFQDATYDTKPWIVDKDSIDEYRKRQIDQFNNNDDDEIALELVNGLNI